MSDQAKITESGASYPDVHVALGDLDGPDGNAFAIMARVERAIASEHGGNRAAAWVRYAMERVESYDALLAYVRRTVTVTD